MTNIKWVKNELECMITPEMEKLWSQYEDNELDSLESKNEEAFDTAWNLGYYDAISEMMRRMDS